MESAFKLKNLLLSLFICLSLACSTSCSFSRSVKDIYEESSGAVFVLQKLMMFQEDDKVLPTVKTGHCSSFHIGNGLVVTAGHCIQPEDMAMAILDGSEEGIVDIEVLLDNDDQDIALLRVPKLENAPFLVLGPEPSIGERVVAIGTPGYLMAETIDIGYVIQIVPTETNRFVLGTGNAFPGESGGPLLDERGFVVGVTSMIAPGPHRMGLGGHIHRDISLFVSSVVLLDNINKITLGK